MSANNKTFSSLVFFVICGAGALLGAAFGASANYASGIILYAITSGIAVFFSVGVNVANQWEKAIILRLGKFHEEKA